MEAKFRGKAHEFYGPVVSDMKMKAVGKRSLEWDLNDWKWDGDLFVASQLNSVPSDCRSRQFCPVGSEIPNQDLSSSSLSCSDELNPEGEKRKRELEKRRRAIVYEVENLNDEAGSLNLKLGGQFNPIMEAEEERWEEKSGKKTKLVVATSNRAVCQVDDCRADLSNAKDYHRRHKVCDLHSKASRALVGNAMQRFCQQCSRFHVLQEFDEGKRSCRRRLAGHNKRRRKPHPDTIVNGILQDDEKGSSYLLISLLRILSNMQSSGSDETKDQDLLSHLLQNLASIAGSINGGNLSGLLQGSQDMLNAATNVGIQEKVSNLISNGTETARPFGSVSKRVECTNLQEPLRPMGQCIKEPASDISQHRIVTNDARACTTQTLSCLEPSNLFSSRDDLPAKLNAQETTTGRTNLRNIDLNNISNDSQDCLENFDRCHAPVNPNAGSLSCPLWLKKELQKSSPPQTGANSDSTSAGSLSNSSGEAQIRTDRIVFKLFGKAPNDFPAVLRSQILNWLSHSPTDIESYIRPGCIILTIYLRMQKSAWEELCSDLGSCLSRLLDASNDSFWRTGWVYSRVQHHVAFIYNGQVVLDTPLPFRSRKNCRISSISPIAVPVSERVQFVIKGYNLSQSTTRLLCALEGKYLFQETCYSLMGGTETFIEHDDLQCLSFPCSIPNVNGRGFIEVEDHALSSSFLPFIVAEQNVCSEICMLEGVMGAAETEDDIRGGAEKMEAKNQAQDFIHEMGWLLHRNHLKFRLGDMDPTIDLFPFNRLKGLMEFAMDHDWCAVVNKLLDIIFSGSVDAGELSVELALMEMCLLHKAVQRNCRSMVELLLRYTPDKNLGKFGSEHRKLVNVGPCRYLFRPDVVGPAGLTPLHIVASTAGSDNLLDALTDDPGLVGIEAWKQARDGTGLTPYDYACMQGHYSYVQLVQKKIKQKSESRHVVVDIPGAFLDSNKKQKPSDGLKSAKVASLETEKIEAKAAIQRNCKLCERKLAYGRTGTLLTYRPSMLSMVTIAAVCVCVALLFKSSPEVHYVFRPFRWEQLRYGSS